MRRFRSRAELRAIFAKLMQMRQGIAQARERVAEGEEIVRPQSRDEYRSLNRAATQWINTHISVKSPWNKQKLAEYVTWLNQRPEVPVLVQDMEKMTDKHPAIQIGPLGPKHPVTYVLGWAQGGATPIHDHADSEVAVMVHQGAIREEVFATAGKRLSLLSTKGQSAPAQTVVRTYAAGGAARPLPAPYIHRVSNTAEKYAASVHAYYPPLDTMGFYKYKPSGEQGGTLTLTGKFADDNLEPPKKKRRWFQGLG